MNRTPAVSKPRPELPGRQRMSGPLSGGAKRRPVGPPRTPRLKALPNGDPPSLILWGEEGD